MKHQHSKIGTTKNIIHHTNKDYIKFEHPIISNVTPSKIKMDVTINIQVPKSQKGKCSHNTQTKPTQIHFLTIVSTP
jgi:hypothetical protein